MGVDVRCKEMAFVCPYQVYGNETAKFWEGENEGSPKIMVRIRF
jgi:hypothetical protein